MADQTEEEMDLKDIVYSRLEKTAFLRNTRAQLRAHIYNIFESGMNEAGETRKTEMPVVSTENGKIALCIIDDLLERLDLRVTSTVMRSETGYKPDKTTLEVKTALGLGLETTSEAPLLVQLLDKLNPQGSRSDQTITLDTNKSSDSSVIHDDTVSNSYNSI